MNLLERIGMPLFYRLDPETAHGLAISALKLGVAASPGLVTSPRLRTTVAGLNLANPLDLRQALTKTPKRFWVCRAPDLAFLRLVLPPHAHNLATQNRASFA